ncbi:nonsense-mediated mRNA decay factor SMG5-like isoform X2 [Clavelina lepadiformis]|uniref:nonsense-mediated mRNA decay factor SMG5-like isoform X2 n=1 Tax=Clavelina lepadiformis TaxID=159417 RepID=UPI0040415592
MKISCNDDNVLSVIFNMPRSGNSYSAKHGFSSDVKSISAKRLYRGVLDCTKKLDAGHQHRRNLISLFQPEQVKLRHKLREACEKLMFTYPSDYGRKAEELLWRKVYYDVIHTVKSSRKFQSNAPGTLQQRHLEPHYRQFLYSAIGYYHYLLMRLQSKVLPGVVVIDFPLSSQSMQRNSSFINQRSGFNSRGSNQVDDESEIEDWIKTTSYRILVCLGDLSRYQMEFGLVRARPFRYYQLALLARPNAGMPHNQLATLAGHHSWWGLIAAYHYCRSLHAEMSFEGAEGNLQKLLDRNKKLFYQLPTDALDGVVSADEYKKEHTRVFVISFLYLCDLLRPKTYATDVETTGLCKRLIDALHVCLLHMNTQTTDDSCLADDQSLDFLDSSHSKTHRKTESKRYGGGRSSTGSVKSVKYHHPQQNHLNGEVVFKICVMCLVNVHDLQTCRSNRSSAAIAFTLAFFSHLLGYLIHQLNKMNQLQNVLDSTNGDCSDVKANGDNHFESSAQNRSKKSKTHLRRRRRVGGSHEADLSEGEEDIQGGGDADSDLSETDSETDLGCLSDSSGSGNRLSQEDLSSQEEDVDLNDGDFASPKNPSPAESGSTKLPENPPPNLAVASLQDLSNKMFQPLQRRKITLAPSFLQNLTLPKDKSIVISDATDIKDTQLNGTGDHNSEPQIIKKTGGDPSNDGGSLGPLKSCIADYDHEPYDGNFIRLSAFCRYNHITAAVKLLCDWLATNERVAAACAKNSRALWSRLVCLINLLPTEKEMIERDDIRSDKISVKQVQAVIEALEKSETERKAKKEAAEKAKEEASLKEEASNERKIKIEKRKTTEENQAKKPPPWKVITALPEDYTVYLMKAVKDAAANTGLDLSTPYQGLSDMQQGVVRVCRLRHLCRFLSATEGVEIDIENVKVAAAVGNEKFTAPDEEQVDPQMELEAVEAMRKARLMKDMAASRLRNEVQALETSLGTPKSRDSARCLYLVPDTNCLCRELTYVRRLVASERFFVVIPKTVIDGLDALKRDLQGARDAIRYLENEFKKGHRFIRAQSDEETVRKVEGEKPKLRRDDIETWRFYRIIECCRNLLQQEAEKTNSDEKEHSGLITLLTPSRDTSNQNISAAYDAAKSYGIQVESAAAFMNVFLKHKS